MAPAVHLLMRQWTYLLRLQFGLSFRLEFATALEAFGARFLHRSCSWHFIWLALRACCCCCRRVELLLAARDGSFEEVHRVVACLRVRACVGLSGKEEEWTTSRASSKENV
jgi:hypothetical protein